MINLYNIFFFVLQSLTFIRLSNINISKFLMNVVIFLICQNDDIANINRLCIIFISHLIELIKSLQFILIIFFFLILFLITFLVLEHCCIGRRI